jgi:hypothetical protein
MGVKVYNLQVFQRDYRRNQPSGIRWRGVDGRGVRQISVKDLAEKALELSALHGLEEFLPLFICWIVIVGLLGWTPGGIQGRVVGGALLGFGGRGLGDVLPDQGFEFLVLHGFPPQGVLVEKATEVVWMQGRDGGRVGWREEDEAVGAGRTGDGKSVRSEK